jgi:hypothetical protein
MALKTGERPKFTYVLHDPATMAAIGKYVGTTFREPAMKAASAGHKIILLRKSHTSEIREYAGEVRTMNPPITVERNTSKGIKLISYKHKPFVKFMRKYAFSPSKGSDME